MKRLFLIIVLTIVAVFSVSCINGETTAEKMNAEIDKIAEKAPWTKTSKLTIRTDESSYKYNVEWVSNVPTAEFAGSDEDKSKAAIVLAACVASGLMLNKVTTAAASKIEGKLGKYVITTTVLSLTTVKTYNSKLLLTKVVSGSTTYTLSWR